MIIKQNKKKFFAFSLIELMVVIAIVGVLAAVAAPLYKSYQIRSKIEAAVPRINDLVDRSVTFAAQNGRFANAHDLGLNATLNAINIDSAGLAALGSPFYLDSNNAWSITDESANCGALGQVVGFLDTSKLGISNIAPLFYFDCEIAHNNGAIVKQCFYAYGDLDNGHAFNDPLFPGWINMDMFNLLDFINYDNVMGAPPFSTATCQ